MQMCETEIQRLYENRSCMRHFDLRISLHGIEAQTLKGEKPGFVCVFSFLL